MASVAVNVAVSIPYQYSGIEIVTILPSFISNINPSSASTNDHTIPSPSTSVTKVSRLNNEYRAIWLDGRDREPVESRDNNWNGESIGHWEDDALVVESLGFTDENHLIQQGIFTGDQLKIVEHITMLNDGNTLKIDFTMTDPEHWVGEWKHTKFRDRTLRSDIREASCFAADNELLPGM